MAEPGARTADAELQVSANGAAPRASGSLPPGPRLPRWVQTLGFILPVPFIDTCRRRYGDLVTFGTMFDPCFVMVFDPEHVKTLFRGSPEQLRAGEANAPLGPVVGERSLLLLDGAEHLRDRKLMLPSFHGERMRAYEAVMREAADREIDRWPVGRPFTLMPSMQALTLDVIMHAVFGVTDDSRAEELKRRVRVMLDPFGTRLRTIAMVLSGGRIGTGGMRQFEEDRRLVDELIYEEIARRRAETDLDQREDVFSMLLLARDDEDRPMSDRELRDELVTLLVAGHETTATGLAWTFELLLRNTQVLERLRAALAAGDTAYPAGRSRRGKSGARRGVPAG
jgi:cytochrome P450 family 135